MTRLPRRPQADQLRSRCQEVAHIQGQLQISPISPQQPNFSD